VSSQITTHRFDNDLVLVAEVMPWLESAAFSLLLPIGAAYDPSDRAGLSGLTCEMSLRGAGERDSHEFIEALEDLGVERGESVSVSHTSLSGATLAENLPKALRIYADLLRRPHLPEDQLEAGRLVALQELRSIEDDPGQKLMMLLRELYYGQPWGRSSQGDLAGLQAISNEEIRRHVDQFYRPNGLILSVAGNIDWDALKDLVGELFGDWKAIDAPLPVGDSPGTRIGHVQHDSSQTQIGVAYESVPYRDDDYFQAWGAVGVLSGGMSSRLFTEVREKRGLCYSVYAANHTLKDRGGVLCYAGTTAERAQETLDVMVAELVRLGDGVEAGELNRLKARIKSALIMQQESSSSRSAAIARDLYHLGRVRTLDELSDIVDALTCETINAYLAEHPPANFTVVTLGQQSLETPDGVS
jgi:predicted Zn-dependent peptidase